MAANGAEAADVGYVLGLTALPWTLKLVNGFIIHRYTFLAMGRRRIWIIGAQTVMILLLVVCAMAQPGAEDLVLLGIAGFVVNMATAFQDVAVDGLAVDIMEEDERARASGMMFGGQSIGITLYMATSNFGITLGAWLLGVSDVLGGLPMMFLAVFGVHLVAIGLMLVVPFPQRN